MTLIIQDNKIKTFVLIYVTDIKSILVLQKMIPQLISNNFQLFMLLHVKHQIFLKPCNANMQNSIQTNNGKHTL